MQLTQFTDLSLRLLIYLARLPEPGMATIAEIAEYYQISRNHLVKVANSLANQGFITTTRGKGGGIQLARPANTIGVGEIVRKTEVNMNLVECFDAPNNQCRLIRNCFLKATLYEAQRAFMTVLDKYTLAEAASLDANTDLSALSSGKP
ncbi:MAG: Rrf2 family transcriptional regulator [Methylobacter sp.]|nr:Rrf2 family transcriptional regulator [Methylobacter sp.]